MKSLKRIKMTIGIAVLFVFLTASFASAEILEKSNDWKNFVAIYGWVQAINGDVKVKGVENNLDVTYSDVLNSLKVPWHYAIGRSCRCGKSIFPNMARRGKKEVIPPRGITQLSAAAGRLLGTMCNV
jgi:hypothetical protein